LQEGNPGARQTGFYPMKKFIPVFAMILGWALTASAAPPATLSSLHAIHELTNAEASKGLPVAFPATVIFYDYYNYGGNLFVQDNGAGIYVAVHGDLKLLPGDRILVRGTTAVDFRVDVRSTDIRMLGHGELPTPAPASFDELIHAKYDCTWVLVHGIARAVDREMGDSYDFTRLQLLTDGGYIELVVSGGSDAAIQDLLDADVEVDGVAVAVTDGKNQATGSQLYVPSMANVKILKRVDANPWSLPVTPMDEIIGSHQVHDLTPRIRVHGTITYYDPGTAIVLEDGHKSLWIETRTRVPMQVGDIVDAIGFADLHNGFLTLTRAEVRDTGVHSPVPPQASNWTTLTSSTQVFDLVSIEGQVVTEVQEDSQDEYVLRTGDKLFTAIFRNPVGPTGPPMKQVPLGSRVRVTGICILSDSNPFNGKVPFNILLRTFDDITVIAQPSLLTVNNLMILVGLLLVGFLVVGARGWFIEHRVRRQTTEMAYIERRSSSILEDINGSRPLAEIIDQITELVSFKLKGAPCWCQIAGGAKLGNCIRNLTAMRVLRQEIPSRSGPPLGELFAAFDRLAPPRASESESLSLAAGLAALAIETRRLYSDLRRRSEFDLLTDIHNRFSLDKRLDAQIEEARQQASIFGLIYIDLDNFKRVNDVYGHQVGDLYLQEVATRMKRQLRAHDSLARLGGDEFAVLVPIVRSRADVQEIALRLERSFDAPFPVDGAILHPAASVGIALYPEDAITKDGLLNAADAAMYRAKNAKRENVDILANQ
jgi:diguanylate cyclase (GGDEF)-like protein